MLALEFPPINELIRWQDIFPTFNKVALIAVLAALIGIVVFLVAGGKDPMVAPTGVRNLAETRSTFIENDIVMQTMGKDGLRWTPFLLSLFIFIYLCNLPGIIPLFQMPATARMAIPLFLALVVWVIYIGVGFKHQRHQVPHQHGLAARRAGRRCTRWWASSSSSRPSSLRPFSLAVRLFANMLAGHILLVTFALLTNALFTRRDQAAAAEADGHPAVLHAGLPHRLRGAGRPSCRPTSSRSSPPCTSAPRTHPEH